MMKRNFLAVMAAAALVIVGGLASLWPRGSAGPTGGDTPPAASAPVAAPPAPPSQEDLRRQELETAYGTLTTARKALQGRLSDLKTALWGVELPASQARRVGNDMMAAQFLLKEPPQMGAFRDVAGVDAERVRVEAALARLEAIAGELGVATTSP